MALSLTNTDMIVPAGDGRTASELVEIARSRFRARRQAVQPCEAPRRVRPPVDVLTPDGLAMYRAGYTAGFERQAKIAEAERRRAQHAEAALERARGTARRLAKRLDRMGTPKETSPHSLSRIFTLVSWTMGVSNVDLMSRRRPNDVMIARKMFCYLAAKHTLCSLPQIGRFLDGRDHTTILYSVRDWPEAKRKHRSSRQEKQT